MAFQMVFKVRNFEPQHASVLVAHGNTLRIAGKGPKTNISAFLQVLKPPYYGASRFPSGNSGAWENFPEPIHSSLIPFSFQSLGRNESWHPALTNTDREPRASQGARICTPHRIRPTTQTSSPRRTLPVPLPKTGRTWPTLDSVFLTALVITWYDVLCLTVYFIPSFNMRQMQQCTEQSKIFALWSFFHVGGGGYTIAKQVSKIHLFCKMSAY